MYTFMIICRRIFLKIRNVSNRNVEKFRTHILCFVTFSRKPFRLGDGVGKYCRAGQTTDDNMAHAQGGAICMLISKARTQT